MLEKEEIIDYILAKKELKGIERPFARTVLEKELRKNPLLAKKLEKSGRRSEACKKIMKAVRTVLRRNVSLFEGDARHRKALLAELRNTGNPARKKEVITHILSTHSSTHERLPFYDRVYSGIFQITGNAEAVLDIGCGLNPISYPDKNTTIIGVDIDRELCTAVAEYFSIAGIEGECRVFDARDISKIRALPKSDIAFVFKLLELLEKGEGHKLSEELIKAAPAKWVVASFPTMTSSGAPMRSPKRQWIEKMLRRLGYAFKIFSIPNEIFYVIDKSETI